MSGWKYCRQLGVLALMIAALGVGGGCGPRAPQQGPAAATGSTVASAQPSDTAAAQTVALEIDFGNGKTHSATVPWREGMTALDVLVAAQDVPGGPKVERRGEGATAFVEAIDGLRNGGGAKSDRNWLYQVNGRLSPGGAGTVVVKPGDRVLWQYAVWE